MFKWFRNWESTKNLKKKLIETSQKSVIITAITKIMKDDPTKVSISEDEVISEIYFNYFGGQVDLKFTKKTVPKLLPALYREGLITKDNILTDEGKNISKVVATGRQDYLNEKRTIN